MIRKCEPTDLAAIYAVINDGAMAYKGIIPADRWCEPYMPIEELRREIADGVEFWGYSGERGLVGVMGIQDKGVVALIRHAYVRTKDRRKGVGTALLHHIEDRTTQPILVGTWADATWAICFYQKNGYQLLSRAETERLLHKYWNVPERQVETSVVLANSKWRLANNALEEQGPGT